MIPALVVTLGVGAAIGSTTLLSGNAQENKVLTIQQIEKKALAIVDGTVADIEFDQNQFRSIYEVEVHTETAEYDLKFDAYTGKLLKQKKSVEMTMIGIITFLLARQQRKLLQKNRLSKQP